MTELPNRGYSLTEALIVLAILGIVAAVTIPSLSSTDRIKLDLAASGVASALRFARSEAMRTGEVHGVEIKQDTEEFNAVKSDLAAVPVGAEFVLYHPVTKQLWDYDINASSTTAGVEIVNTTDAFDYAGLGRRPAVLFNALGAPFWITTSDGNIYRLRDGEIRLGHAGEERSIRVAPITGRVTVQ